MRESLLLTSILVLIPALIPVVYSQTTEVTCESVRPPGCTDVRPADCPLERVQTWLPQSNIGVPFGCGRCYYCKRRPTLVEREDCRNIKCPVIPPTCNDVKPLIIYVGGRRCRGCSKCLSYNNCPPPRGCPRKIRGCEIAGPAYKYVNGSLCEDCDICLRYKGSFRRPPSTPHPCPEFSISNCPMSDQCLSYENRFINLNGERRCQICPECKEWRDPNERLNQSILSLVIPLQRCPTATNCGDIRNCTNIARAVSKDANGNDCRECDTCVEFQEARVPTDVAGDQSEEPPTPVPSPPTPPTSAPSPTSSILATQNCPLLYSCPSMRNCQDVIVNTTTKIVTDQICRSCQTCGEANSNCPPVRCPGAWCESTAIYQTRVNGIACLTCVCIDSGQDCSGLTCPEVSCTRTTNSSVILGDHLCRCPICDRSAGTSDTTTSAPTTTAGSANRQDNVDGASDARPDTRDSKVVKNLLQCSQIIPNFVCSRVNDCSLTFRDTLVVNGTECLGCPRCLNDALAASSCPSFNCPAIECGDNEDVALGKRYRETERWIVNGNVCNGCDKCLRCTVPICPPLDLRCRRYTRRVDRRGCQLCEVCEVWNNRIGPPIVGKDGFFLGFSPGLCLTSGETNSALTVDVCRYDLDLVDQIQVWKLQPNGLIMETFSGRCLSYNNPQVPIIVTTCDVTNPSMIWFAEKSLRYPQFFHIKQRSTSRCLNIVNGTSANASMSISDCETYNGFWTNQWWRFDEYIAI